MSSEVEMHNKGSSGMPTAIRWYLVVVYDHFSLIMAITVFVNLYLVQPVLNSKAFYGHY